MPPRLTAPVWPPRDAAHLLVSGGQMASLEEELFASGLPVEALMEKAALAVSRKVLELLAGPGTGGRAAFPGALVLVGPGHNGGDGLVVARELHLAGVSVRIWCPFERRKPLTEAHLRHARWLGVPLQEALPDPADPALWIDAIFGIGQSRPPGEPIETILQQRQRQRPGAMVCIDVPTGVCADSGLRLGKVAATATVTYCVGLIKRGLVQDAALASVGRLERIDLALPGFLLESLPADQPLGVGSSASLEADRAGAPCPALDPSAGKYGRGRLLVVAGSHRYRGAAHLALAGASASGCGSLRAALPEQLAGTLWQVQPHVVLEPPLGATASGSLALAGLAPGWLDRLDAVLLGPGLGGVEATDGPTAPQELLRWEELQRFEGLVLLDADGLNRLAEAAGATMDSPTRWLRQRQGPTWITPHPGEFARLFPDLVGLAPLEAAQRAATGSGAAVLLKGARSVVASPEGHRWQLLSACPEAARAGLGDVLAGYAAGRGAMAQAATAGRDGGGSAILLAAAALDHAQAGLQARRRHGTGGATPMTVAAELGRFSSPRQHGGQ